MKRKWGIYISVIIVLATCLCLSIGIISTNGICISMKRTICYGTCPVYRVTILGNGTVIYVGERFVKITGIAMDSISREKVGELVNALGKVDFLSFHDYTSYDITDAPDAITTVIINGKIKTVRHYYGDRTAPQVLTDLESQIDEIANSGQWTGK